MSVAGELVLRIGEPFFSARIRFRKTSDSITSLNQSESVDATPTIGARLAHDPYLVLKS